MDLKDILRAQNIKRWTIVNTCRNQSLAEHTFNVIAIAREICKVLDMDDSRVMKYAFDHDLDEVFTGDIPTPAKKTYERLGDYHGKWRQHCSGMETDIVKTADIMEALLFIRENGVGRHANECKTYLMIKLDTHLKEAWEDSPRYRSIVMSMIEEIETMRYEQ